MLSFGLIVGILTVLGGLVSFACHADEGAAGGEGGEGGGQDKGGGKSGGKGGSKGGSGDVTYSQAQLDAAVSKAIGDAQGSWQADLEGKLTAANQTAQQRIDALTADLGASRERSAFLEAVTKPGVNTVDAEAAYHVARAKGFIKDGKVDMDKFRREHPALFGSSGSATKGGVRSNGANSGSSMDDFIRTAAGMR